MPETVGFTINVPAKVERELRDLIACGYYGTTRAAVAVNLIMRQITTTDVQRHLVSSKAAMDPTEGTDGAED